MSPETRTSRNRRLLGELLSTRTSAGSDTTALLELADALESAGLQLTRWTSDGPGPASVRIEFQDERDTLSATLSELTACASRHAAGHPTPWNSLRLPEGRTASPQGRKTRRTHGMQQGPTQGEP